MTVLSSRLGTEIAILLAAKAVALAVIGVVLFGPQVRLATNPDVVGIHLVGGAR